MALKIDSLDAKLKEFILAQKMFFVATAMPEGRINLSPKGLDTLKILTSHRVIWLNLSGSGNETATHIKHNGRITLMFCAFEGNPLILRLYGSGKVYHPRDKEWNEHISHFPEINGARQIVDVHVDLVQTSCGMGVPLYEEVGDRKELVDWAVKLGDDKLHDYWIKKNQKSLDGLETGIINN